MVIFVNLINILQSKKGGCMIKKEMKKKEVELIKKAEIYSKDC